MAKAEREVVAAKKKEIETNCEAEVAILRDYLGKVNLMNPFVYSDRVREARQKCLLKGWWAE